VCNARNRTFIPGRFTADLDMQPIVVRICEWRDNGAGMKVGRRGYKNGINKRMMPKGEV